MREEVVRRIVREELSASITRGRVTESRVGGRVMLQVTGLDNEVLTNVELMQSGVSGRPAADTDVLILAPNGRRDGAVAIAADAQGSHIDDAQPGERGLRSDTGMQIVVRLDGIDLLAPGETLRRLVTDLFLTLFNAHTHPTPAGQSGPPSQPMTAAHLTGATRAGGP